MAAKKAIPARVSAVPTRTPKPKLPQVETDATPAPDLAAATSVPSEPTPIAAPASTEALTVEKTHTPIKEMLNMDKVIKTAEEMVSFGQGNVEALLKSSQIWAAGVQDLGKHFAATAQAQMDETVASVKALSAVKSIKEVLELQATLTKSTLEKLLSETGKLTDASVKLAEQAIAPITERVTLATEKFGRSV